METIKRFAIIDKTGQPWQDLVWYDFDLVPEWAQQQVAILDAAADETGHADLIGIGTKYLTTLIYGEYLRVSYIIEKWK